ncbi:MAG TPA: hypothetical protein VL921_16610, partial [Candidatus Udaeobacter sp.]|nr:hypothetical protein [Candidatus Udaeobacter sp.]
MTLRKKLAVSTIAASVALTAFAGIPLSSQGLAEKLGVSGVAYAALSLADSTLAARVKEIRDAIVATGGEDDVKALQDAFNALSEAAQGRIAAPVVDKFVDAGPEKEQLKVLFREAVSLSYNPSVAGLEDLRADHGALIQSFATKAKVADLTVDDIAEYFFDIQTEFIKQVGEKSFAELSDLMMNPSSVNNLLETVLGALPKSEYAVEKVFLHYGITTEDVLAVLSQARTEVNADGKFIAAAGALFNAYESLKGDDGGDIGGGLETPAPTFEIPKEAADLAKKLSALKDSIAKATGEEKAKLIEAAVKEATTLATKLSVIENTVTIVNGK